MTLAYQSGFGNAFASEAVAGALPQGRNSPQRAAHGLYAPRMHRFVPPHRQRALRQPRAATKGGLIVHSLAFTYFS